MADWCVIEMPKGSMPLMLSSDDSPALGSKEPARSYRSNSWDSHMADAFTFLISARASVLELTSDPSSDPQGAGVLTLVSAKVEEALSALDDLSVANWIQGECVGSHDHSLARLPTWSVCLDGQVWP
jgi:hypothetical protein